ncbi:MAG: sodium:solute symporter family protein [Tepidibacillus sp.]
MSIYVFGFILYLLIIFGIGIFTKRYIKDSSDFLVGGRRLNTGLLFTTLLSANIGAGSTVGVAGLGYINGVSAWWWIGASAIGSFLLAYTVGPKIWELSKQYNFITLGDYLEHRYHTSFRLMIAAMMAIGTLALFAGQLIGISWILTVVVGTSKTVGVLIGAIVVSLYFVIGGLLSSAIVNVFQLSMILFGFIISLPFALNSIGGWDSLVQLISQHLDDVEKSRQYFSFSGIGIKAIIGYIFLLTPSFIISPGLIQKIFGAKDEQVVKKGTAYNGLIQLFFAFIPVIIGMTAFAAFPELTSREMALPMVMKEMLPVGISVLALAAIFAAEASTADAVLFMITSSLAKDIYATYINKKVSNQELLKVSRMITIVSGVAGVVLALYLPNIIASLSIFYSLMSVAITAPLLFGLYSKGANTLSAFLASGLGIGITLVLNYTTGGKGFGILTPQAIGMIVSIGLILLMVLFAKPRRF